MKLGDYELNFHVKRFNPSKNTNQYLVQFYLKPFGRLSVSLLFTDGKINPLWEVGYEAWEELDESTQNIISDAVKEFTLKDQL